jgi:hypothetical protein
VVVWQLKGTAGDGRDRRALRVIAAAFALLTLYIAAQAAHTLLVADHPGTSAVKPASASDPTATADASRTMLPTTFQASVAYSRRSPRRRSRSRVSGALAGRDTGP